MASRWASSNRSGRHSGRTLLSSPDDVLLGLAASGDLLEDGALLLGCIGTQDPQRVDPVEQQVVEQASRRLLPRCASPRDDFGMFAGADVASLIAAG